MKATVAWGLLFVASWEAIARLLERATLPPPSAVLAAFPRLWAAGLGQDVVASMSRVTVGFFLAALLGTGLGAGVGLLGKGGEGIGRILSFFRPIPPIAWVPLAILWFGLGDRSAWAIVFVGAFFPIFTQVGWALGHTPPALLELATSLGTSRKDTLLRVRLPSAVPAIAAGLRTGLGLAWTSVVAAELVGAQSGLGYRIQTCRVLLDPEGILLGMGMIGVLGLGMDRAAALLEGQARRRWAP